MFLASSKFVVKDLFIQYPLNHHSPSTYCIVSDGNTEGACLLNKSLL